MISSMNLITGLQIELTRCVSGRTQADLSAALTEKTGKSVSIKVVRSMEAFRFAFVDVKPSLLKALIEILEDWLEEVGWQFTAHSVDKKE